jgi:DNA-binding LytR/AlgR family response regulator
MIKKYDQHQFDPLLPPYANSFLIFTLHLVSFGFYIRYVGSVPMSIPIVFKLALLSLFPPISLWLHDLIKDLKKQREELRDELEVFKGKVNQYEADSFDQPIEFISESNTDNFKLLTSDVALIKSADNYVEIVYNEGDGLKSKLIRNTLKNIELQLKVNENFVRCHRTCIVNVSYVEKLAKDMGNHWLSIKGHNKRIPVSRQYLLKIKEAL